MQLRPPAPPSRSPDCSDGGAGGVCRNSTPGDPRGGRHSAGGVSPVRVESGPGLGSHDDQTRRQDAFGAGRYPSGQRGQTVNLLAHAFGGSNPSLPTMLRLTRRQVREAHAVVQCSCPRGTPSGAGERPASVEAGNGERAWKAADPGWIGNDGRGCAGRNLGSVADLESAVRNPTRLAGVVQWQNTSLPSWLSRVRIPSPAPNLGCRISRIPRLNY